MKKYFSLVLFAHTIFAMPFAKVFPLLIAKAERKGRTRAEVYEVTTWLTGYTAAQLDALNPLSILTRGYAVAKRGDVPVRSVSELKTGDALRLTLSDGEADVTVTEILS